MAEANALAVVPVGGQQQARAGPSLGAAEGDEGGHQEDLSDLEEEEACMYLHTPEEAKLKELIWTELNRDYLERQSAKAAAQEAAAAKVLCLLLRRLGV
jgi:transcription factor IIIB subunit 2